VGFGTERLEEEIRRLFPRIRLARLDREEAAAAQRSTAIVRLLWAGELDLVIGTQMLFQRGPLPKVGFVGIPHADGGLQVPDFRSAERTYGSLLDALLLARPAESGGRAVIQTALASHHAIAAAIGSHPQGFYQSEAAFRETLGYPPVMHLIRLSVTGKDLSIAERAARRWRLLLQEATADGSAGNAGLADAPRPVDGEEIVVLGPAPAPVPRVRGRYVWHLLIKSRHRELALQTVRATLEATERLPGVRTDVDVDPIQFT
jgi:primosomal protein N' (replication factor Y)